MAAEGVRFEIDRRPIAVVLLSRLRRQLWLAALLVAFGLAVGGGGPAGLSEAGFKTLCVFGLCVVLWATALLPLAITSLLAMALLPLTGAMEAGEAYRYFGSKVVFFILGAFMLSAALTTSGLSTRLATLVVRRFGQSPRRLVLAVFGLSAAGATVMSSHAVAAMIFPIVVAVARALDLRPLHSKLGMALFFALAWGCIIGGSLTILGGGRGPLAIGLLEEATTVTLGFSTFIAYTAPLVGLMLLLGTWLLGTRFEAEIASTDAARDYLDRRLHELGKMSGQERLVGATVLATVALWALAGDQLGLANIALVAVALLFVLGAVSWHATEQNVSWGVIVMYGGAICLGGAMESSGAAAWLTDRLLAGTDLSPTALMIALALTSAALTEFMSNSAVVAMLMPPALSLAAAYGIDPRAMTMTIVLPSNFAFMFPVSTPVTAIAWSAGYFTPRQVAGRGLLLHLFGLACMILLITWYWPLAGLL